jgi:WD40 repeat protein
VGPEFDQSIILVSLWDPATGQPAGQPFNIPASSARKACRPDGLRLAIVDGKRLRVWNTKTGQLAADVPLQSTNCNGLVWHPSLDRIALALGAKAMIYDLTLGRMLWPQPVQHSMPITSVCFSPDGKLLVTACANNLVNPGDARLWNAETGQARGPELRHKASEDFTALVWDIANAQIVGRALRQPHEIHAVCFASKRRWLATGCRNGDARVWDLETSEPLTPPLHHNARITRVRFVDNDNALLAETDDGRSWLWRFAFDERPVEQIERWARILSADRSGPPLQDPALPSVEEALRELNASPAQSGSAINPNDPQPHK